MMKLVTILILGLAFSQTSGLTTRDARNLIKKWAPLVKLASGEDYKPSSVDWFLPQVDLTGYSGTAPDPVTPSNIPDCNGSSDDCYLKTQESMSDAADRSLDVFDGQDVTTGTVPTYAFYEASSGDATVTIHYWMFFPFNLGKKICWGFFLLNTCLGTQNYIGNHVGDWERVSFVLKKTNSGAFVGDYIVVGAHGDYTRYTKASGVYTHDGETISFSGNHPIIYLADGSHGTYVSTGTHKYEDLPNGQDLEDKTSDGDDWQTWKKIVFIKINPLGSYSGGNSWANYEGRWGNEKDGCVTLFDETFCSLNQGPSGPGNKIDSGLDMDD